MFLVDTAQGRIVDDDEIKAELAAEHPYADWLAADQLALDELPPPGHAHPPARERRHPPAPLRLHHRGARGCIVGPMAKTGAEPIGSMGSDTSIAVLSDRSRLLYDYFTQLFAQVTNPPLDAIREELVTSLAATVGPEGNLLEAEGGSCRQILLPQPVIGRDDLAKLMYVNEHGETPGFKAFAIDGLFPVGEAGDVGPPDTGGWPGPGRRHGVGAARRVGRHRRRRQHHRALGPQLDHRARPDPVAPARGGRPPPPGPREDADQGRPGRRDRRRPRGPPHGAPHRLRRPRPSTPTWRSSRSTT